MEAERWQTIERLYHSALEREASQRGAFLEHACGGDDSLRSEVESLLAQGEESGSFLEASALEVAARDLAQDRAGAAGGTRPTDPMIGATVSHQRAPGRVDYGEIPGITATRAESFQGTARFELRRWLGAGGFGVVYEAYDREHDAIVALKTLQQLGAGALYRFKHEFRALADLDHPNLIRLYELSAEDEHWFFTMELEGVNFRSYMFPEGQGAEPLPNPDMKRLRDAFRQLAEGVRALHQAGKLHCDLKPSNVLVDRTGRVVILDFGMVAESDAVAAEENNFLVGTPAYLSPEQASVLAPSPASDWYSVGVMLFEALTGQQPFRGSVREILHHKRRRDPPAPANLVSALPPDLDALCRRLLSRDPKFRPSGEEVGRCLGGGRAGNDTASWALRSTSRSRLIGRERHLAVLREAFESTREGRLLTVWVHGRSGVGKTALAQRFLDEMRHRNDLVVLEGRCYEREAVPYNALDGVVDNLDRYVKSLPRGQAQALMPDDLGALMRLFPVLQEWRAFSDASPEVANASDLKELRQRGFAALHLVLDRVAMHQPVVVFIDDLQWGDEDSADLLADLIHGETASQLYIACYRTEEADSSPLLRRLTPLRAAPTDAFRSVELALQELDPPQAVELASRLLEEARSSAIAQAQSIAREAQGNPFFIGELVRYAEMRAELQANLREFSSPTAGASEETTMPSLTDAIRARFSGLSAPTRRLLEVVAVAGQPVDLDIAKRAARLRAGGHAEIQQLRASHLIRTRKTEGAEQVEAYHDRIREVTESSLEQERLKQHHYRLAVEWEESTRAAPRVLAIHFRGAGIPDKAFDYAVQAAQQAEAALALGGAADFYRFALEELPRVMPDLVERDRRELDLRRSLFALFYAMKGNSAPEVIETNERVLALVEKTGTLGLLVGTVVVRGTSALGSGNVLAASAFGDQALKLALREGSPGSLGLAYMLQIFTCFSRSDLAGVEKYFLAGRKFFDDPAVRGMPGVAEPAIFYSSFAAWTSGRANIARERNTQLMVGVNTGSRHNVALSVCLAAWLPLALREYEQAETLAARALELAEKDGFGWVTALARCFLGSARAQLGRAAEGVVLIREGIAAMRESSPRANIAGNRVQLAVAQKCNGAIVDALETVEQALQGVLGCSERSAGLRVRGELRLEQGQTELAEGDFREAIALARGMDAKIYELHATARLAEMLAKHGRRDEARAMLAEIYGWFTEGFDTADLKDAKALLEEL